MVTMPISVLPDYYSHRTDGKTGDAGHTYSYSQSNNLEVTSNYRQTFDNKHRFDALVGYSYQKNMYEGFNAWNADFNNDFFSYNNLGLGQELKEGKASMGSYKNDDKLIGFFGRVSYGYDNRYNLLLSMRREVLPNSVRITSGVISLGISRMECNE